MFCFGSFFFFRQRTAYVRRISDWISDVCSSALDARYVGDLKYTIAIAEEFIQVPAFVALVHCRKHTADAAPDFENAGIPGLAQSIERPCILDVFQPVESLERESSKLPEHERVIERAPVFGLSNDIEQNQISVRIDRKSTRLNSRH